MPKLSLFLSLCRRPRLCPFCYCRFFKFYSIIHDADNDHDDDNNNNNNVRYSWWPRQLSPFRLSPSPCHHYIHPFSGALACSSLCPCQRRKTRPRRRGLVNGRKCMGSRQRRRQRPAKSQCILDIGHLLNVGCKVLQRATRATEVAVLHLYTLSI